MGCEVVNESPYAVWHLPFMNGGPAIPVAYIGFLSYAVLLALSIYRLFGPAEFRRKSVIAGLIVSGIGTAVSGLLTYQSVTFLHTTCLWCLASASIMTLTFISYCIMLMPAGTPARGSRRFDVLLLVALAVVTMAGMGFRFVSIKKLESMDNIVNLPPSIDMLVPVGSHVIGPYNAPFTIIEFGDLTCPHCQKSFKTLDKVVKASDGKVRLVFRQFPLIGMPGHEQAVLAATISEIAADHGKFWEFVRGVYSYPDLAQMSPSDLYHIAGEVGLDEGEIRKRLGDQHDDAYQRIVRDFKTGRGMGIDSTPTFFFGKTGGSSVDVAGPSTIEAKLDAYPDYVKGL